MKYFRWFTLLLPAWLVRLGIIEKPSIATAELMRYTLPEDYQNYTQLLAALILSSTREYYDVHYAFQQINRVASDDEFDRQVMQLVKWKWLRLTSTSDEHQIQFTADGWSVALVVTHSILQESYQDEIYECADEPEGGYARFWAYWLKPSALEYVNSEWIDLSVRKNFALLCKSTLLWELPMTYYLRNQLSPLLYAIWPGMVAGSKAQYKVAGQQDRTVENSTLIDIYSDVALFLPDDGGGNALFMQPLDHDYLARRQQLLMSRDKAYASFCQVLDLYILALLDPMQAQQVKQQFNLRNSDEYTDSKWLELLEGVNNDLATLEGRFQSIDEWLPSHVNGQDIAWGALSIDLLSLHRLVGQDSFQAVQQKLRHHSLSQLILNHSDRFVIADFAKRLLKDLASSEEDAHTKLVSPPDAWDLWIGKVNDSLGEGSREVKERLVWIFNPDDETVFAKVQKKNRKGWSEGRRIELYQLSSFEQYAHLLKEQDTTFHRLVSSQSRYEHEIPLNKALAESLSKCSVVLDTNGHPVTLVAETSMLVLDDNDGQLQLSRFPKTHYPANKLFVDRGAGMYSFMSVPDSVANFFELAEKAPSVPAIFHSKLTDTLGQQIHWFDSIAQKGSVFVGTWDPQVHLWLNLVDAKLEAVLMCQSLQGEIKMPCGGGDQWCHGEGRTWYKRDLGQERQLAAGIANALDWQVDLSEPMNLRAGEIPSFLDKLKKLESPPPIHWHASSKRVKSVRANDVKVSVNAREKWFSVAANVAIEGGTVLDLQRLLAARRSGYVELEQENVVVMIDEALRKQLSLLDSVLDDELSIEGNIAYPLHQLLNSMQVSSDDGWQALEKAWQQPITLDEVNLEPLRDYQRDGVKWAAHLLANGFGACLADDMGLGKTLQALKLVEYFAPNGPTLVVCPKSVLYSWQKESARFSPALTLIDVEQSDDRPAAIANAQAGELVLISYGLVTRLAEALEAKQWEMVVIDEAQQIKNPVAKRAKVISSLRAERRLTLSGTPVENHLVELWSQFAFLNPGLLGSLREFKYKYAYAADNNEDMLRLKALVSPFILRRMKSEVLGELPEKTELVHQVELSSKERSAYEAVRRDSLEQVNGEDGNQVKLLAALTRLRQVCCDPHLVFETFNETSSKLKAALELVQEALEGGHRILVFSQFVQLLKRFSALMEAHNIGFSYLDGQSSSNARKLALESFKSGDSDVFLISLKAGGTGLNLTEADTVVHLDPWWNPAAEDQASDRAHRMGQKNPVTVYRLVATNTIEEKIIELHHQKRDLADKVLSGQGESQQLNPALLLSLMSD